MRRPLLHQGQEPRRSELPRHHRRQWPPPHCQASWTPYPELPPRPPHPMKALPASHASGQEPRQEHSPQRQQQARLAQPWAALSGQTPPVPASHEPQSGQQKQASAREQMPARRLLLREELQPHRRTRSSPQPPEQPQVRSGSPPCPPVFQAPRPLPPTRAARKRPPRTTAGVRRNRASQPRCVQPHPWRWPPASSGVLAALRGICRRSLLGAPPGSRVVQSLGAINSLKEAHSQVGPLYRPVAEPHASKAPGGKRPGLADSQEPPGSRSHAEP